MLLNPLQGVRFSRRQVSQPLTVPPPTGGWVSENDPNARNADVARILDNYVPRRRYIETRQGSVTTTQLAESSPVETLIAFDDGTAKKTLAACGTKIYDVVTVPPSGAPPAGTEIGTGYSNARWQHVVMANANDDMNAVMVNGADGILTYNITDGIEVASTTPALPNALDVTNHKNRLWFCDAGKADIYYAEPLSNKPANLTALPVGPLLRKGGSIVCIDSLSIDGGSGPDDYLIAISTHGELVVFRGTDPASDFALVGVFHISSPAAGPRSLAKVGGDLMYFGDQGPEALGKLYGGLGRADVLGVKIQQEFENAIQDANGAFGFEMLHYSTPSWLVFNIPVLTPSISHQYVYNLENKAWFRITGWNANCMAEVDGQMFIGGPSGEIVLCDYGFNDNGASITCDFMGHWTGNDNGTQMHFKLCVVTAKSSATPMPAVDMLVDYDETLPTSNPSFPTAAVATPWETSEWNTSPWSGGLRYYRETFGLKSHGYVAAFRYREIVLESASQLWGYRIVYEEGDIL